MGLKPTQGMYLTTGFYWIANDETRAWAKRFFDKQKRMPTMVQAGQYSSIYHYLRRSGGRHRRHHEGHGCDEEGADQRLLRQNGVIRADGLHGSMTCTWYRSKPADSKVPVGLLHHPPDHPGRPGLPAAVRVALPAGQEISLPLQGPGGRGRPGRGVPDGNFGIPSALLGSQLLIGLINGSFYAILSLGLAIIFGLLNIINFAHGAQYMMGAFIAWLALTSSASTTAALIATPIIVGAFGVLLERTMLRLYKLDHLYGLLLTFGIALIIEGIFRDQFGISGQSYDVPELRFRRRKPRLHVLPIYRGWIIVAALTVCFGTWFMIERTKLGAYLRAGTENSQMVQALGINDAAADHLHLRLRRDLATLRECSRRRSSGQSADGLASHHRGFRGGGDRRHGLIIWLHRHRPGPRADRGLTRSSVGGPRSGRLRDHGHRPSGTARRPFSAKA